jgi:peptidoglycan hydrolase-like protein with peptidoglycan-binding domain
MSKGFDCATKLNKTAAIELKRAGFEFVARYLGNSWKTFNKDEAKAITEAGLKLISIFEKSPLNVNYFTKAQGVSDAKEAESFANAVGQPHGTAIYFTVDYDAQPSHFNDILAYLEGVRETLKNYKVGLYGSYSVMMAVKGKVDYYWQTYAWSKGKVADHIHMHQYQNGVTVAGVSLDRNDIKKDPGAWVPKDEHKQSQPSQPVQPVQPVQSKPAPVLVPDTYIVKSGDTLGKISAHFGLTVEAIVKLNGIKNPDLIRVGEVLKLKSAPKPVAKPSKDVVPYPGHAIKKGSKGKDVERIQRAVGANPDGVYGPKTEAAVKAYQKRHGLAVDGIIGPKTWSVMF